MNPFQDGCYRRLIDHYMETRQPLPYNDAALARIVGISKAEWADDAAGVATGCGRTCELRVMKQQLRDDAPRRLSSRYPWRRTFSMVTEDIARPDAGADV